VKVWDQIALLKVIEPQEVKTELQSLDRIFDCHIVSLFAAQLYTIGYEHYEAALLLRLL
jgi:hypothetical protein